MKTNTLQLHVLIDEAGTHYPAPGTLQTVTMVCNSGGNNVFSSVVNSIIDSAGNETNTYSIGASIVSKIYNYCTGKYIIVNENADIISIKWNVCCPSIPIIPTSIVILTEDAIPIATENGGVLIPE